MSVTSLTSLKQEVRMLRSFAVSIVGKDTEGVYRPPFVRDVLRAAQMQPNRRFTGAADFLAGLSKRTHV